MPQDWTLWGGFAYWLERAVLQAGTGQDPIVPTSWPSAWQANPPLYIEMGNELNALGSHPSYAKGSYYQTNYPNDFGYGAFQIYTFLSKDVIPNALRWSNYHILTGGVIAPYTTTNNNCQANQGVSADTLDVALNAIRRAVSYWGVPVAFFGAAVHPYGYNTIADDGTSSGGAYWANTAYLPMYLSPRGDTKPWYQSLQVGSCWNLKDMIDNWHSSLASLLGGANGALPLLLSEINYDSTQPVAESAGWDTARDGAYLADLFSWLSDRYPLGYPLRAMWFSVADDILVSGGRPYLGLYQGGSKQAATAKSIGNLYCPALFPRTTSGASALDALYGFVSQHPCY